MYSYVYYIHTHVLEEKISVGLIVSVVSQPIVQTSGLATDERDPTSIQLHAAPFSDLLIQIDRPENFKPW